MIAAIFVTTIVALGVYITTAYNFSTSELSKTFKDYKTSDSSSNAIEQTKPISILLMGVDTGDSERTSTWEGNSDSMILVTVNPETKKTTMTSLERDVLVTLTGPEDNDMNGVEAKLNAAYASGGAQMAIMTVQSLLDITIDYYVQINMQGLVDLVDAVGGITVTNNFDFAISMQKMNLNIQQLLNLVLTRLMVNKLWFTHVCVMMTLKVTMDVKNANVKSFKKFCRKF